VVTKSMSAVDAKVRAVAYLSAVYYLPEAEGNVDQALACTWPNFAPEVFREDSLGPTFESEAKSLTPRARNFLGKVVKRHVLREEIANTIGNVLWGVCPNTTLRQEHRELLVDAAGLRPDSKKECNFLPFRIEAIHGWTFLNGIRIATLKVVPSAVSMADSELTTYMQVLLNVLTNAPARADELHKGRKICIYRLSPALAACATRDPEAGQPHLKAAIDGTPTPLEQLMESLVPPNCKPVRTDRMSVLTLLSTPGKPDKREDFTEEERVILARIAKGFHSDYPVDTLAENKQVAFVHPMEGILAAAAPEGAAFWSQHQGNTFRRDQFPKRFENVYLMLYLLVLYQRHGLGRLLARLEQVAGELPPALTALSEAQSKSENEKKDSEKRFANLVNALQAFRLEAATFNLNSMFPNPTGLANEGAFYFAMREAQGVERFLENLYQSAREIDRVVSYRQELELQRRTEHTLHLGHQREKMVFTIVIVAELFAGLYYSNRVFEYVVVPLYHALGAPAMPVSLAVAGACFALFFTGIAVLVTSWIWMRQRQAYKTILARVRVARKSLLRMPTLFGARQP